MPINITNQTTHKILHKNFLKRWLTQSAKDENKKIAQIDIIVCSDEFLLDLNLKYLNHNTLTDIITFDYNDDQPENTIAGEIFISADRVAENALKFNVSFNEELKRVMVHGVMHLCGYKDKTPKHKAQMTEKENFYLGKVGF